MPKGIKGFQRGHPNFLTKESIRKISKTKRGKKMSAEYREKCRERMLKNPLNYWLGKKRPELSKKMKGHSVSTKTREKIRLSNLGKRGRLSKKQLQIRRDKWLKEKNPNWKGGIVSYNREERRSNFYNEWKKSVFKRDNYTCWICDEGGKDIIAHHLKRFSDYPELRFIISNGVVLCRFCHKNYTPEYGNHRLAGMRI